MFNHTDFQKVICPGYYKPEWTERAFPVFCEIKYKDMKLSITGVEGPLQSGNARGGCGQINPVKITRFLNGWNKFKLAKLNRLWDRWHLNDLHPGCEHQRALGWEDMKLDDSKETGWHVDIHNANLAGWVRPEDHPRGVLCKPCPVCGYKYGSSWNREIVNINDLDWLRQLPDSELSPAWV